MGWQKPKCLCIARSPWCKQITQLPAQRLCQIPFNIKVLDQGRDIQMSVSAADIPPNLGYSQLVFMHLLPKLFSSSCQSVWTIGKLCPFRHLQQCLWPVGYIVLRCSSGLEGGKDWKDWNAVQQNLEDRVVKALRELLLRMVRQGLAGSHRGTARNTEWPWYVWESRGGRGSINVQIINFLKHWTPKRRTEPKSRGCFYERKFIIYHRRYGAVSWLDGVMWLEDINWNSALHFRALRGMGNMRNNLGI